MLNEKTIYQPQLEVFQFLTNYFWMSSSKQRSLRPQATNLSSWSVAKCRFDNKKVFFLGYNCDKDGWREKGNSI
jgi:hypothetical protein